MHRLRNKKKNKEDGESESHSGGGILSGKSFKRNKNVPAPVKPVLDLTMALPPTDDFRTSLLMPNLAQRFSILAQDQASSNNSSQSYSSGASKGDDPNSFNFSSNFANGHGLSDIAETGSISGSIGGKGITSAHSRDSHDSEETGGVMSRPRPSEGNVLFGGRQKVFRVIETSSTRGSSDEPREGGGGMGGRIYYDNDIPASTFAGPKMERKAYDEYDEERNQEQAHEPQQRPPSPPTGQPNNNRNTSSSTNSTPTTFTRSSTAATSVNSQHPSTTGTSSSSPNLGNSVNTVVSGKPRRPLYEQALEEQLQEQQNQLKRDLFGSQRKHRGMSPPPTNRHSPIELHPGEHSSATSPAIERNNFYDNGHNQPTPITAPINGLSKFHFGLDTKLGGNVTPGESVSPTDYGRQQRGGYDDEKYHLIQQQKLQPREPSPPNNEYGQEETVHKDASKLSLSPTRVSILSVDSESGKSGLDWDKVSISPRSSHAPLEVPDQEKRQSEAESHQTFLSTPSSDEESEYEDYDGRGSFDDGRNTQQGIGLGLQGEGEEEPEIAPLRPQPQSRESRSSTTHSNRYSTASTLDQSAAPPGSAIATDLSTFKFPSDDDKRPLSPLDRSPHLTAKDEDSPTLPPVQGLSVMVRQHLRTDSGRSSIYSRLSRVPDQPSNAGNKSSVYGAGKLVSGADVRPSGASGSSGGNVWEFDDWDGGYYAEEPESPSDMIHPALRKQSVQSVESAIDKGFQQTETHKKSDEWQDEKDYERDGNHSSDEDNDRNWEDELAHRRKLVQQSLREHESRSSSPVPEFAKDSRPRSPAGIDMLRKKTSNGVLSREDNKAMRMLGINSDKREDYAREEERLRETVRGAKNIPIQRPHPQHPMHPQDREFRQGPPHQQGYRPHPNLPPMGNRPPPPQLEDHPAMRPRQYPRLPPNVHPMSPPNGPPVPMRSPMRGPSLRDRPSREALQSSDYSPRMMSPPRSADPRWRDDRQFDGPYSPPHRSANPNPHSQGQGLPANPRMGGPPRMGSPMNGHMNGHMHDRMDPRDRQYADGWDRKMNGYPDEHERRMNGPRHPDDRRMDGPRHPEDRRMNGLGYPDDRRMNGPTSKNQPINRPMGRNPGSDMGRPRGPPDERGERRYPDDRQRDDMGINGNRGINGADGKRDGRSVEREDRQQFSPESSPPPSATRSRGNSNAQPPNLNRARSESVLRRDGREGTALPPLQISPPRNAPPPLTLNPASPVEKSPMVGKSPNLFASSPITPASLMTPSTTVSTNSRSIGYPSSPSMIPPSPALSSAPPSASAALAKIQSFQTSSGPAAKKRVVDKSKISEPKLIASTSNIPTVPLPPQDPTPPLSAPLTGPSSRKRRQTTTNIFGGFGKNYSMEKMPSDGEMEKSSFMIDEPKKEKKVNKLRKSTSDGGSLSARARKDAMKDAPATPSLPSVITMGHASRQGMI